MADASEAPSGARQFRKRRRSDSDSGEEGAHVDVSAIRELREDQKARVRARGVDVAVLAAAVPDSAAEPALKPVPAAAAALAGGVSGGRAVNHATVVAGRGFKSEAGDGVPQAAEAAMEEYIQARLREYESGGGGGDSAAAAALAAALAPKKEVADAALAKATEWLYEMPEAYRGAPKAAVQRDGDVGEGGVMLSGTGIVEVSLPDSVREKNVQRTRQAMEDLRSQLAARASGELPGRVLPTQRPRVVDEVAMFAPLSVPERPPREPTGASDDALFKKFRGREIHRK